MVGEVQAGYLNEENFGRIRGEEEVGGFGEDQAGREGQD